MTSILVVEDEAVVAMDIQARLTRAGYRVCGSADTGEKAIQRALERKPDLVLMDITIKGDIDGVQTSERLRGVMDIPVVFLTAYADEEIVRRAKATEPFGYVIKPFEDRELQVAIEMAIHRHRLTVQLREANERLEREILARSRAEQSLRTSEERYELAARGANDGIWDWDLRLNRLYTSPRWKSMLGYGQQEIAFDPAEWLSRVHEQDRSQVQLQLGAHLDGTTDHFECEFRMLHRDGSYRWMLSRGLAVRDAEGCAYRIAGSQSDTTERKRVEEQLLHDALHDSLTGLPNRTLFIDRLSGALERAKRRPEFRFAVLFLDFDGFKAVNDGLGHTQGDLLLVNAALRLREAIRSSDTAARFGGDEFVFLLEDLDSPGDAHAVAERIQQSLREPFMLGDHVVHASASIGLVVISGSEGYGCADEILRDADIAMYRAKALGRSRNEVFEPGLRSAAMSRLRMECDLRNATERGEMRVQYQPVASLKTGKIAGFEALVRWQHPRLGLVSPSEFLPVAEETGTINPIGDFVLREACGQLRQWREQFPPAELPLFVSVNISPSHFSQPDLPERVRRALEESAIPGANLRLEVPETVVMNESEATRDMLARLKRLGVGIDVNDFGAGYSSLAYLQRLPIDSLKIDSYFVKKLDSDPGGSDLMRTLIMLAHELSMNVVGQGVETSEQLSRLKSLSCEFGQGYLMSRPVDADRASAMLSQTMPSEAAVAVA